MFSNINPYVCCNQDDFFDEINFLRDRTFPKIYERLIKLNINFDPVLIDWNESNDYVRSGNLLRLLLTTIKKSSPFLIGLIGHRYGAYLPKTQAHNYYLFSDSNIRIEMNWLEKNNMIAAQTGFGHVVSTDLFNNSLLEHQINQALDDTNAYPFYRFYFRQFEYFEEMYSHLSIEQRKQELKKHEAENEYCEFKIKEIKMKLAKKGLIIKYYKSLEQLNDLIYDDFIDLVAVFLSTNSNFIKTRSLLKTESLIFNKLNQAIFTSSLKFLSKSVDSFLRPRQSISVTFKLENQLESADFLKNESDNFQMDSFDAEMDDEKEDFLEILKLRHLNISSSLTPVPNSKSKHIFAISGPRGRGKTTFMASLYQKYLNNSNTKLKTTSVSSKHSTDNSDPFYLFYFLKPEDYLINILVNITSKLRAKYLKKDSNRCLDSELYDQKSIIEQFNAAILLGPVFIFIDGLSELDPRRTLSLSTWLPKKLDETECKFVFSLRNSSDVYKELRKRVDCVHHEMNLFQVDSDYELFFRKSLCVHETENSNVLYAKFLSIFNELKTSEHIQIFKNHPVHLSRLNSVAGSGVDGSLVEGHEIVSSRSSASSLLNNSVNIMNSYIEEVSTIREIIQKILKRYLRKNNWSVNKDMPLSLDNPGWIGDTLCLIAMSLNGITKETILRILRRRGYDGNLKITEFYWNIFRMQFGNFLQEGLNGVILFSHVYFKEAVQALLLDGFSVNVDVKSEEISASVKKNISEKQKEVHKMLINDILECRLSKSDFDSSAQIQSSIQPNAENISQNVLILLHELIHHLFMIFDLNNLHKLLTNFKLLQIFESNRLKYYNEWLDLCNMIKTIKSQEENRHAFIKNLTQNIQQYEFEIVNTNQLELKYYENISENMRIEELSKTDIEEYTNKESIYIQFESIDNLVDCLLDTTSSEYLDSINLLLINRSLILNDLVKYIDDKVFQENIAFSLLNFVQNIVTQVSCIIYF
ncbi:unnamed protein product [Brachionus calyciflorus]|uniref:Nephrocystin 3-like N-terminal domain-containing protein n=1 Tax=Brachionus calyciflorus TaxID=104777 RepID=A0A813W195_9BILA|nr:unnamed protein product [Brachionus calyciflorus]